MTKTKCNFKLGQTVMTQGINNDIACNKLDLYFILDLLQRHRTGDWGNVCEEDWKRNDEAVKYGHRIDSSYSSPAGEKIYIITEYDRSVTTILYAEEY